MLTLVRSSKSSTVKGELADCALPGSGRDVRVKATAIASEAILLRFVEGCISLFSRVSGKFELNSTEAELIYYRLVAFSND
jgi:hypothetical protein